MTKNDQPGSGIAATLKLTRTSARMGRGGRPSKQEHQEISVRILECASTLFARQGYAATSVEQIAAACSMGKDTIYRRYASKAALFEGVIARLSEHTFEQLNAAIADEGPALARLKQLTRSLLSINLTSEFIAFKRIALSETLVHDHTPVRMPATDPIRGRVVALIEQAQADGAMREGDADFMADSLIHGTISGPVIHAMLGHSPMSAHEQDAHCEQAWALFLQGAGKPR